MERNAEIQLYVCEKHSSEFFDGGNAVGTKAEGVHKSAGQSWTGIAKARKNGNIAVRPRRTDGLALALNDDESDRKRTSQASGYDMPDWKK